MADHDDTSPDTDENKPATPPATDDLPEDAGGDTSEDKPEKSRYRWRANHLGTPDNAPFDQAPPDYIKKEFARRLNALLIRKGWTQSELSRQASALAPANVRIGRDIVSKWILGQVLPTPVKLGPVCKALGCSPEDLIPARGLSSATSAAPTFSTQDLGHGLTWLRVNKAVPHETALKVMELLSSER